MVYLVKVEGTLEEMYELFGSAQKTVRSAQRTVAKAKPIVRKAKRARSAWQKYIGQKKNQVKFKRGPKKGLLDMKAMSKKFKRSRK